MTATQTIEAPCKVNLHLGIHTQLDERGYHRVDSVMAPVGLFDTVTVSDADTLTVCHEPALCVAPEKTTVWKAATLLAARLGIEPRVRIDVVARIPEKAGLGGSSADAGATLRLLAERWGVAAGDPLLAEVARQVGADVAFFLDPRPALYLGGGDVLEEGFSPLPLPVALIMPAGEGVSAKAAYEAFDACPVEARGYGEMCAALREAGPARAARVTELLFNNLAPAAKALQAGCAEVEAWAAEQDEVKVAIVTGSGSCVFAVCEDLDAACAVAERAAKMHNWWSYATLTVGTPEEIC